MKKRVYDCEFGIEDSVSCVFEWHENFISEIRPDYWVAILFLRNGRVQTITEGYYFGRYYRRSYIYDYVYDNRKLQKINKFIVPYNPVCYDTVITKFDDFNQTTSKRYCKGYNPILIMDKIWKLSFLSLAHPNLFGLDSNVLVEYLRDSQKSVEYLLDDDGYVVGWNEWEVVGGHPYLNRGYVKW